MKCAIGILSAIIITALLTSNAPFLVSVNTVLAQGGESESFDTEFVEQLAEIYQQKHTLTSAELKIDSRIIQVVQKIKERIFAAPPEDTLEFQDLSTPLLKIDRAGNIDVKLNVKNMSTKQITQLEDLGMDVRFTFPKYGVIEGSLPYEQIQAVADLDFVVNVGTPDYPLYDTGDVTSEGDTVLRAAEARAAYSINGSGIKKHDYDGRNRFDMP